MHVHLEEFLRSGSVGPIAPGMPRHRLRAEIGAPDEWWPGDDASAAQVWRYGRLEFHFLPGSDTLWMIFADQLDRLGRGGSLGVDPWIITPELRLEEAEGVLVREGFQVSRVDHPDIGAVDLVLESGVVLRFHRAEADDALLLGGIWCAAQQPQA